MKMLERLSMFFPVESECANLGATVTAATSDVFPYDINKDCFWGQQTFNGYYFNQVPPP